MPNVNAGFWNRGIDQVERMTGLGTAPTPDALAGADIREVCRRLGILLPVPRLLDVGCGTGRLRPMADAYLGVDISESAIAYCVARDVPVLLVDGPDDLTRFGPDEFDWVWACSVFTHIGRDEQQRYLGQFVQIAPRLLVDILPGDSGRGPARWGTDEATFRLDLVAAGYRLEPLTVDVSDGTGPTAARHRYFVGVRA
jgi:SAM-dependent methyltransferase